MPIYLFFSLAERDRLPRRLDNQRRDRLETATDVVIDERIPDRKWVEPPKENNNLFGYRTTL